MAKSKPMPGHPVRRAKPYIWSTWLAKLAGGDQCLWSGWFKAQHQYAKHEENAQQLQEWNRAHTQLMTARKLELQREGYVVYGEEQNAFTVIGQAADVAGKPDLIGVKPDHALLVDGKTGRQRDSDIWQVLIYLWGIPRSASDIRDVLQDKALEGEVHYQRGDERIAVSAPDESQIAHVVSLITVLSGPEAPSAAPSKHECGRCNIGPQDCPVRYRDRVRQAPASAAVGF